MQVEPENPADLRENFPVFLLCTLKSPTNVLRSPLKICIGSLFLWPEQGRQHDMCESPRFGQERIMNDEKIKAGEGLAHVRSIGKMDYWIFPHNVERLE
jgi:hypothetical protein